MTFFGLKSKVLKEREARGTLPASEKPALSRGQTDLTKKSSNEGSHEGSDEAGNFVQELDTPARA